MTKFKKVLLASTAAVMTIAVAIGGTMAYLTSEDSDVNVMTVGNVEIEQHEYERVQNADGSYELVTSGRGTGYKLKEFTQAKPLYPAVGTVTGWDSTVVWLDQLGEGANGGQQLLDGIKNVQDKIVVVENTGKSDAYVRTVIAFELGSLAEEQWEDVIMTNIDDAFWNWNWIGSAEIENNNYYLVEIVYTGSSTRHTDGVLPAGEFTYNSLAQVYMRSQATNEDVQAIDGNANGVYDIFVYSQAVQTNGFENAQTALDAAFGDITATQHPWTGKTAIIPAIVDSADDLVEALANNEDVILVDDVKISPANMSNAYGTTGINVMNGQTIDGAGNVLDIKGAGGTWDSGISTTGGTIKNITVTGSFRGVFINHNSTHSEPVILENVVIDGTVYTISCDQGIYQTLTAKNSTFNGWTSYAATLGEATFIECSFGEGSGYKFCRPYAPTTFVGCDFSAGYEMDPRAAVTFENCTINGEPLTASNLSTLVISNIANATVK